MRRPRRSHEVLYMNQSSDRKALMVEAGRTWTFLTNHAHVLLCLAHGESLTARELGSRIGITERAIQVILADLTVDVYLKKTKQGRRNLYTVNRKGRLRHPLEAHHTIGELITALD